MEQLLNDSMYTVDLGNIDSAAEIIFQLSTILDNPEVRNKKICLKLGNVDLNQAQLLSIKSLIGGINSILSSVDTKSVETERVALSLGIIVSNVSAENTTEVTPAQPYKTADEYIEQINNENSENTVEVAEVNQEQTEVQVENNIENNEENLQEEQYPQETQDIQQEAQQQEETQVIEENNSEETAQEEHSKEEQKNEEMRDELDVIFGSNPVESSIFNMETPQNLYEENHEMDDIVVPEQEFTKEDIELESFPTKYIKQTIRSGQVINYEGNIVIIGDCHPGCEITAFGDITVWGVLSGIAHAGSGGNQKARVRALKMNAIQLRIANCYSRRPDSLNTVYIEKTNSYTPEEARIINNEIVVFKIND